MYYKSIKQIIGNLATSGLLCLALQAQPIQAEPIQAEPIQAEPIPETESISELSPEASWNAMMEESGTFYRSKRFDLAVKSVEEALNYSREHFGGNHLKTAAALYTKGEILYDLGKYGEAAQAARESLVIRGTKLPFDDVLIAVSANSLAQIYQAMGEFGKARPLNERALMIWRVKKGKNHPYVAVSLNNLGKIFHARGAFYDYKAKPENSPDETPEEHKKTADQSIKDFEQAIVHYKESLAILENTLKPEDANIGAGLYNLAETYAALGKYDEAEANYLKALKISGPALGKDNPHVLTVIHRLAVALDAQGKDQHADRFYATALRLAPDILTQAPKRHLKILDSAKAFYTRIGKTDQVALCEKTISALAAATAER